MAWRWVRHDISIFSVAYCGAAVSLNYTQNTKIDSYDILMFRGTLLFYVHSLFYLHNLNKH